ncbi:MAG: hypothetical protein ACJ74Q_14075, partial [Pyrinomonadaceae bacterium]
MKTGAAKVLGRAATCAALAVACAPAWLILRYGVDVPYLDQWEIAPFFEKLSRGTLMLSDLFAQQNEYRQLFPHLIFVALGRLTGWNVKYEMLASLLLACFVAYGVRRLGALTFPDPLRRGLLFLLANLLIFSTIQYDNWLFGVQVVYFMPAACVVAGLLVAYSERVGTRAAVTACACLSAVAMFSSANGIVAWLVLPPALLGARAGAGAAWKRWLPLWCAGLALCVAVYAQGYHSPASHPSTSEVLYHPFDAAVYFVAFLGGPLAAGYFPLAVALVVGAVALLSYAFACAYLFKFRGDRELLRRSVAWASLGVYSLGTGAFVTVGRLGFGVGQAVSTRYAAFSLYLLVALIYLLPCVVEDATRRGHVTAARLAWLKRLGALSAVLLLIAHVLIFVLVLQHGAADWRRARLGAKACLLFIEVIPEERCLAELYPDLRALRERAGSLDRMGYLRPPLIRAGHVRALAADGRVCSDAYGSFERLSTEGGGYVAEGHARLPRGDEPADAVVLAYGTSEDDQTVFALAGVGADGLRNDPHWRKAFPADALPVAPRVEITAWA